MADLEAHAEISGALVDEEDGEDFVVDDGADEVGDPVHESVEIEGGVEGVGEVVWRKLDLEGFDANFGVCGVGRGRVRACGGAVVALEGVLGRVGVSGPVGEGVLGGLAGTGILRCVDITGWCRVWGVAGEVG